MTDEAGKSISSAVSIAERKIGELLKDFEIATGLVVDSVSIDSLDVRTVDDIRPRFLRRVRIVCHQVPGNDWEGI